MAKLSKRERADHAKAEALLALDRPLTEDEQCQVLANWHEGARHLNGAASAHFTPYDLAFHLAMEARAPRVLDLCAGIGALSVASVHHNRDVLTELVLIEINPDYAEVARKLLPQAEVIVGSVYDRVLMAEMALRGFDVVIANPPFGSTAKNPEMRGPRYKGRMDYEVIDIASDIADAGVFVLPQNSLPFAYSGRQNFAKVENAAYDKFSEKTGIVLEMNCGIDTSALPDFRDVKVVTEIAVADFAELRRARAESARPQNDLFTALENAA